VTEEQRRSFAPSLAAVRFDRSGHLRQIRRENRMDSRGQLSSDGQRHRSWRCRREKGEMRGGLSLSNRPSAKHLRRNSSFSSYGEEEKRKSGIPVINVI